MKFSFYSLLLVCVNWRIFPAEVDLVALDNIIAEFRIIEQHLTAIYAQSHHLLKLSQRSIYAMSA